MADFISLAGADAVQALRDGTHKQTTKENKQFLISISLKESAKKQN